MKQNVFFFGVAYALSIGSILLLGGRKDVLSKVDSTSVSATAIPAIVPNDPPKETHLDFVPDRKPDFPTLARSRFAMTQKLHSLDVFHDSPESSVDDLPPALSLNQTFPKTRLDSVNIAIAQSDPFSVDENVEPFESPAKPVPAPIETSNDELDFLAPVEPETEDPAKLAALRESIATLTRTKAELLNAKALEGEISQLQKEIANLQAAQRLLDARNVLEKLIQQFPDSPAADRAKSMLKTLPSSTIPKGLLVPIPDPNFTREQHGA